MEKRAIPKLQIEVVVSDAYICRWRESQRVMGCRLFLIEGGVDEVLSTADGWVYESHKQAPLLDNPGGGVYS